MRCEARLFRAGDVLISTATSETEAETKQIAFLCSYMTAVVAQLVEHVHGKDEVSGSIPDNGSMGGYRSGQPGQTVNLLAYAFVGSNPTPPTILTFLETQLLVWRAPPLAGR
jgi:hypothetical protein